MQTLNNVLKEHGYNPVALPKADIAPMQLLVKEGDHVSALESDLTAMFPPENSAPPTITRNVAAADIKGSLAVTYDIESGITVLDWLLTKLNLGKLEGKMAWDSSKVLVITYTNIKEDKVSPLELDRYLTSEAPDVAQFGTYGAKLMKSDLYVIHAVLKSNTFNITVVDNAGANVALDAVVNGLTSANASVTYNNDHSLSISSSGSQPLAFAVKGKQIIYKKPGLWDQLTGKPGAFTLKQMEGLQMRDESDYPSVDLQTGEYGTVEI